MVTLEEKLFDKIIECNDLRKELEAIIEVLRNRITNPPYDVDPDNPREVNESLRDLVDEIIESFKKESNE